VAARQEFELPSEVSNVATVHRPDVTAELGYLVSLVRGTGWVERISAFRRREAARNHGDENSRRHKPSRHVPAYTTIPV
jgi:hypothetical protein